MLRLAGIVALFVLAACGSTSIDAGATPSPVIPLGNWTENLKFAGDVTGQMSGIVPDTLDYQTECTGSRTHNGETWSDSFYGFLDSSGQVWGVVLLIGNFRGAGTYANSSLTVQLHSIDNSQVWESQSGDTLTVTIDRSQQAGTIDATMTNSSSGKTAAEHVTGSWHCKG